MKLSGNNRGGRHLSKNVGNNTAGASATGTSASNGIDAESLMRESAADDPFANAIDVPFALTDGPPSDSKAVSGPPRPNRRKRIILRSLIGVALVLVAVIAAIFLDVFAGTEIIITPPPVNPVPRPNRPPTTGEPGNSSSPALLPGTSTEDGGTVNVRDENKHTFLIFGLDDEGGNTDVIMVATMDSYHKTLDVISVPRDTLVNVDWSFKKANSIFPNMMNRYRSGNDRDRREELAMQASIEMFADILGFEVDYWLTLNMRGFAALIDAIDGVDFNIPVRMYYHDPYQNLLIDYQPGMHRGLTGRQALEILRYRGYASADIGRIQTQQRFLTSAVDQILARRNSINVTSMASIFMNHVRTNIPLQHLAWLGLRFLEMEADNINFAMIPGNSMDFIGRPYHTVTQSYVTIYLDDWLEMLNTRLNPFSLDKTAEDLSILTRGEDRRLYVTDGNWVGDPGWGATSRGPNPNPSGGSSSGSGGSSSGGNSSGGSSGSSSGGSSGSSGSSSGNPGSATPGSLSEGQNGDPAGAGENDPSDNQGEPGTSDSAPDNGGGGDPNQYQPELPAEPPPQHGTQPPASDPTDSTDD